MAQTLSVRMVGITAAAAVALSTAVPFPLNAAWQPGAHAQPQKSRGKNPRCRLTTSTKLLESGFQHMYQLKFDSGADRFLRLPKGAARRPDGQGGRVGQLSIRTVQREGRAYVGIFSERREIFGRRRRIRGAEQESTIPRSQRSGARGGQKPSENRSQEHPFAAGADDGRRNGIGLRCV